MTFEECVKEFPIWQAVIGNYGMDGNFTLTAKEAIDDIEDWPDCPLEWNNDNAYDCAYPFVVYVGDNKFECWYFAGQRVNGYLNESADPDAFYPATYSDDFGWEPFDPENSNNYNTMYFTFNDELRKKLMDKGRIDKLFGHKWMTEQVAYMYDNEKYMNGEIFTTYEQIKKFVREKL